MNKLSKSTITKTLIGIGVILVLLLLAWLLWPKRYDEMIPAQAKAVIRIDPQQLMQQNSTKRDKILKRIAQANSCLDLSQPIYGVVTPNEYLCVVAKVKNEDNVKVMLSNIEGKTVDIEDEDSRHWTWLADGWLASWDDKSFLCIGPGVAQERDVLRQTISSMVNSDDKFVDSPAFKTLKEQPSAMQVYAQLDAIPTPYNMLLRFSVPADCDPAAIQIFASAEVAFNNGECNISKLSCNITSENADIVAAIDDYEKQKGCIELNDEGTINNTLFCLATRTQGKPLLQLLKTDATLRGLLMGLNQTFDADRLLGSTNGLFSIEIGSFAKDWTPAFCMKAETHTPNLFADADYWMECARKQKNVTLKQCAANEFFLSNDKQQLNFGEQMKHSFIYFVSPSMKEKMNVPFVAKKSNKASGTLVFFHINTQLLNNQPCMKQGQTASLIHKLLPNASHGITYTAQMGRKASLIVE